MKNQHLKSSLHISIPSDILGKFNGLTNQSGQTRNQVITQLISQWVEDYEDYLLAQQCLQELDNKEDTTIAFADLHKHLASEK